MPGTRHTWLFEPGLWIAAGRFFEGGRVEREARGTSLIRHTDAAWEVEGELEVLTAPPVRFQNTYRVEPPRAAGGPMPWRSENPAVGTLVGVFTVAGDAILSFFQTPGREHGGSETLTQLGPDRYRACGLFVSSRAVVSTWAMELVRRT